MPRFLIAALAAAVLLLPATAEGHSNPRVRGTVALKVAASHLVTVSATRQAFALRVPGSLSRIRVGQHVELRGSTLRARGHGSPVLARGVMIASSEPLSTSSAPRKGDGEDEDDEVEIRGKLTSLSPATVVSSTRVVSCLVPAGKVLTGFVVNDRVEMTCDLVGTAWTLRTLEHEDDAAVQPGQRHDDDEDEDDGGHHSGPGGGGHDEDDD